MYVGTKHSPLPDAMYLWQRTETLIFHYYRITELFKLEKTFKVIQPYL